MLLERVLRKGLAVAMAGGAATSLFLVADCRSPGQIRSVPLYPQPEERRAPDTLAQLTGPIATVDGVDVESKGTAFDLLPGCHVVTLRKRLSEGSPTGAWVADVGVITYAFRMKPGHLYSVDTAVRLASSSEGTLTISAQERDRSGTVVSFLESARNTKDIEDCRQWDEETAAGSADGGVMTDPLAHNPDGGVPPTKTRRVTAFPGR